MNSRITSNVRVSVVPEYDVKNSFPTENRYVFRYTILIENLSSEPVKLLRRKWVIYDVGAGFTEISGDGVIGLTPEIEPEQSFNYFSNVILHSGVGTMHGSYLFKNEQTGENFEVEIPKFELYAAVMAN